MGMVHCYVVVLVLSAQLGLSSPVPQRSQHSEVTMCKPGEYQKSGECAPCPDGTYTSNANTETSCHYCLPYSDCRSDFNLKVVENCTTTSNLKCRCEDGFICTEEDQLTKNCRECGRIRGTTTAARALISTQINQTHTSSGHSSTSVRPCQFPDCGSQTVTSAGNNSDFTDKTNRKLAAILCPMVALGCVALVILFCVRHPGGETCFKIAVLKLCNEGGKDESTHQFTRDSSSAKNQPFPLPAATLGPVHVHNPGTVIFSLLSQFTGQVDPTREEEKRGERERDEEEERDCPVFNPTPSPCIHLSKEERNGEVDRVFFPSQEQGKECHMSKEEVL